MKVRVLTTDGDELDYEVSDRTAGFLQFEVVGGDPDLPAKHWLSDLLSLTVSEHPQPITQTAPSAEYETVIVDKGTHFYGPLKEQMREIDPTVDKEAYRYKRLKAEPKKPAKKKAVR